LRLNLKSVLIYIRSNKLKLIGVISTWIIIKLIIIVKQKLMMKTLHWLAFGSFTILDDQHQNWWNVTTQLKDEF